MLIIFIRFGLKVGAWTVDDKKYFKKLVDMGVDAYRF